MTLAQTEIPPSPQPSPPGEGEASAPPPVLRAIDVCCGAGGWACAARGLPIEIVAAFDREADALRTYKLNHPATACVQCDVASHDFSPWKGIDLILGGIPCEQLSVARNNTPASRAEKASIRRLLAKFLSLPAALEARFWCYEDVVQLRALLPKRTPWFILDSGEWSGQARRRLYVGNCPLPIGQRNRSVLGNYLRPGPHRISLRILDKREPSVSGKHRTTFQPFLPAIKSKTVADFQSRRDAEVATPHPLGWRQLEWQECAELQGFPQDYLFAGPPGRVSKMIAQAVQIDTARAILAGLLASLQTPP